MAQAFATQNEYVQFSLAQPSLFPPHTSLLHTSHSHSHKMEALSPPPAICEQSSPLLRLPPELRNTIYELVANPGGDAIILSDGFKAATNLHSSLVATCRQLRDEFLPVFYNQVECLDRVQAKVHDFSLDDLSAINRFMDRLPKHYENGVQLNRRALEVTLVFKKLKLDLTEDPGALERWVTAVLKCGGCHAYKVEVNWSCYSFASFSTVYFDIARLCYEFAASRHVWWELHDILVATRKAVRGRAKELERRAKELKRHEQELERRKEELKLDQGDPLEDDIESSEEDTQESEEDSSDSEDSE